MKPVLIVVLLLAVVVVGVDYFEVMDLGISEMIGLRKNDAAAPAADEVSPQFTPPLVVPAADPAVANAPIQQPAPPPVPAATAFVRTEAEEAVYEQRKQEAEAAAAAYAEADQKAQDDKYAGAVDGFYEETGGECFNRNIADPETPGGYGIRFSTGYMSDIPLPKNGIDEEGKNKAVAACRRKCKTNPWCRAFSMIFQSPWWPHPTCSLEISRTDYEAEFGKLEDAKTKNGGKVWGLSPGSPGTTHEIGQLYVGGTGDIDSVKDTDTMIGSAGGGIKPITKAEADKAMEPVMSGGKEYPAPWPTDVPYDPLRMHGRGCFVRVPGN